MMKSPKPKVRSPKKARIPKTENGMPWLTVAALRIMNFGFVSNFEFQVFRHDPR